MAPPPWPQDVIDRMCALWDAGRSGGEIAAVIDKGRSAVMGKIYRMYAAGFPFARERLPNTTRIKRRQFVANQAKPKKVRRAEAAETTYKPRSFAKKRAYERELASAVPVDITGAKPWTQRAFGECAYPVAGEGADTLSCCAKTPKEVTYCLHHQSRMYAAPPKRLATEPGHRATPQRRFAA